MRHSHPSRRILGLALGALTLPTAALLGSACGASSATAPPTTPTRRGDDVERQLALEEARLDRGVEELRDESAACPDRCRSSALVCDAADHICEIVRELGDLALEPRCERATHACADAEASVSSCGCVPT